MSKLFHHKRIVVIAILIAMMVAVGRDSTVVQAEDSCPTTTTKTTVETDKGFKCDPQTKVWGPWTKDGSSGSTTSDPCEGVTTDVTMTTTYSLKSQTLITSGPNEGSYEVYWTKTVTTTTVTTPGGTTTDTQTSDEGPLIYTPECCECDSSCTL